MRTLKECKGYVDGLNACMFAAGNKFYFRINYRNGYKALDRYCRCKDCLEKMNTGTNVVCSKDTLIENIGCYTTGELYEVTRVMNKYRYLLS